MPDKLHHTLLATAIAAAAMAVAACHHLDDDRIPVMPVNIVFATPADWDVYGVHGALSYKSFIREQRVPRNFPYTALTYTGYGGVLLLCDVRGVPQAYDLSCPVEHKADVRIAIDEDDEFLARCPTCGSTYDVFSLTGHPVGGPAAKDGYALRRYSVGAQGSNYMVVSY